MATNTACLSVNLRIVQRCLTAIIKYLEAQTDADSRGLLASISDFRFVFGVEFLVELFVLVNYTSLALQSQDTDLHLAGSSVGKLTASIAALRSDASFKHLFATAKLRCDELSIDMMKATDKPRKRKVPTALRGSCMLSSFLTLSSDAVPSNSAEQELENRTKLDFFLPVIDAASGSIDRRFNAECLSVLKHISSLMARGENFDNAVRQLCSIAKLDGDLCVAEGNLLFYNEAYRSADSALMSMSILQCLATAMAPLKHNLLYKHFYQLVVFLLTLPVTSASCERAHSKVNIVKSAVRSSMNSERDWKISF